MQQKIKCLNMVRKLLLIISDGGGNSPLRGVHIDKENFLDFFKSPEGGAWKDEEINVFDENNFDLQILAATDLAARLDKQPVDFYLIVFCGHGFTDENNQIHFEVRPNTSLKLADLLSTVARSRCLVIADSCRAIYRLQDGGRIANQRLFSTSAEARNSRYSELCHAMYNKLIGLTPSTMQLVYFSNSYNETADENPRDGGVYCHELLTVTKRKINELHNVQKHDGKSYNVSIDEIHQEAAATVINKTNSRQHPEIYLNSRSIARFPFIVVPHWQLQIDED